jgi:LysM repeat protein
LILPVFTPALAFPKMLCNWSASNSDAKPLVMRTTIPSALVSLLLLCVSCMSAQTPPSEREEKMAYVQKYCIIAVKEMERSGIPASIKLGQGVLESRWGTSDLARLANNHFGIKCGSDWQNDGYYKVDDDVNDKGELIKSCFRVYEAAENCYRDHSEFLMNPKKVERYGPLFKLSATDYEGWAHGLKKGGYATDPGYANKLIRVIEDLELHQYDQISSEQLITMIGTLPTVLKPETSEKPKPILAVNNVQSYNDVKFVVANPNQTMRDIASKNYVSLKGIVKYNEHLSGLDNPLKAGTRVFLQHKPKGYRGVENTHKVRKNERMIDISVLYAIRLDKLYQRNRMTPGQEPAEGAVVKIRGGMVDRAPKLRSYTPDNQPSVLPTVPNSQQNRPPAQNPTPGEKPGEKTTSTTPINPGPAPTFSTVPPNTNKPPSPRPEEQKPSQPTNIPAAPNRVLGLENDSKTNSDPFGNKEVKAANGNPTANPAPASSESSVPVTAPMFHLVAEGDTLETLAQKFKTSTERLKKINNLSEDALKVGSKIRVK